MVPTIAPQYTMFGPKYAVFDDSPEWGSASILAAWGAYRFYGDAGELKREYPAMQRYIAYLEGRAQDGIVAYGLGDWYDIGPGGPGVSKLTTQGVTGTLMLYEDAMDMRKIALLLRHADDANRYGALAEREKAAFNARFWDEKAGYYDRGSQTANAMPLALGVVPEEQRAAGAGACGCGHPRAQRPCDDGRGRLSVSAAGADGGGPQRCAAGDDAAQGSAELWVAAWPRARHR